MEERRRYERFSLRLSANIQAVSSDKRELIDLLTRDVSAGGAFLHTRRPLAEGTEVKLRLIVTSKRLKQLTGSQSLLRVTGTVTRTGPNGMAVCFDQKHHIMPLGSI